MTVDTLTDRGIQLEPILEVLADLKALKSAIRHENVYYCQVEYLLKWRGYADDDNTWEPADNLDCTDLIEEFERKRKEMKARPGDKRKLETKKEKKVTSKPGERLRGFERRLDPERIVGATDSSGELMFLIKVEILVILES